MSVAARALASAVALCIAAAPVVGTARGPAKRGAPAQSSPEEKPAEGDDAASEDGGEPPEEPEVDPTRSEAETLFREGTKHYELGQYDQAVAKFQAAWELNPAPALLYNMGRAQWRLFDVEPEIDHLRKAREFFRNYNKRMQSEENYASAEVDAFIAAITAQIEAEEAKEAERNRPVIQGPSVAELEAAERAKRDRERKLRIARGMNISGITLIVVGSTMLAMGLTGVLVRSANKLILDNTSGGDPGTSNQNSVDEDSRRRRAHEIGGQIGFAGLIAAVILLPIGIGLRVGGGVMEKKLGATKADKQKRGRGKKRASVRPTAAGLSVRF